MRPSLTRRLLTLYVATILVVGGVAAGVVWGLMRRALHRGLDETLLTEGQAVAGRLESDQGRIEFESGSGHPDDGPVAEPLLQIVDARGGVVFCSRKLKDDRTLTERVLFGAARESPRWFTTPLFSGASDYRVLALRVVARPDDEAAADGDRGREAWVLVARSLGPLEQTLVQLGSVLLAAVAAAGLVGMAGGVFVARSGTRPVRALAESVGRVNPGDPELRLDGARVPVELAPIVQTTERLLERVRGELSRQRQLTADVAHDLRTPVAGVRMLLDVCLQRERSAPEYAAAMAQAQAALRQLSQLLDDVLTLARIDAGFDEAARSDAALDEVLAAAVATVQPLAAARGVTLRRPAALQTDMRTDRGKLVKILINLLSNAVEHSPVGEVVELLVRTDGGILELAVTDRGVGIEPAARGRVFDRFVRGDAARGTDNGHHGLGLPIAAGLARLLGGEVRLDEHVRAGSRFVVRLPLR